MTELMTVSRAADQMFGDRSARSIKAIHRMVALKDQGPFSGARKADPDIPNSPILIPVAEVKAFIASKNKKAK